MFFSRRKPAPTPPVEEPLPTPREVVAMVRQTRDAALRIDERMKIFAMQEANLPDRDEVEAQVNRAINAVVAEVIAAMKQPAASPAAPGSANPPGLTEEDLDKIAQQVSDTLDGVKAELATLVTNNTSAAVATAVAAEQQRSAAALAELQSERDADNAELQDRANALKAAVDALQPAPPPPAPPTETSRAAATDGSGNTVVTFSDGSTTTLAPDGVTIVSTTPATNTGG